MPPYEEIKGPNCGEMNCIYMSLRDYFAGQALAGLTNRSNDIITVIAEEAYLIADAMLKERNK